MVNMKIKEKVVLITGSGRGLGRIFAEKLASEGTKIVINEISAI